MPNKYEKKTWIVGYGDIGHRVAAVYQQQGQPIDGTVRSKKSQNVLNELQAEAGSSVCMSFKLDLDKTVAVALPVPQDCQLFYFVPPPPQGKQDTRIRRFLEHIGNVPRRIVLISTTGVYGDCKGEWVDETHAVNPLVDRAWRRVDAEQHLMQWAHRHQREFVILRVPGIYARNRLPVTRLQKGLPVVREDESPWSNRIHADDLANVCYQAMKGTFSHRATNEIINVSDGKPSTMTHYFNQVADTLQLPRPPQISRQQATKELSKGMLGYMQESRKISNEKMLNELHIKLRYPALADGLKKS